MMVKQTFKFVSNADFSVATSYKIIVNKQNTEVKFIGKNVSISGNKDSRYVNNVH